MDNTTKEQSNDAKIAAHVLIEKSAEDLGTVTQNALQGICPQTAILKEAERQEMMIAPSVRHIIELGAAMQSASTAAKDFEPFKLVVESTSTADSDGGPPYAEITITPALLNRLIMLSKVAEHIGVSRMPFSSETLKDTWGASGSAYMMEDPEITVFPCGENESGSFVISGRPHNTSDLCETKFINLDTLMSLADGQPAPEGFHRNKDGVVFYSEDDAEELAEIWAEDLGTDAPTMG